MMSCPEAMGWEFGDFEKDVSLELTVDQAGDNFVSAILAQRIEFFGMKSRDEKLTLGHVDRLLGFLPLRQTVEKLS